jgi:ABC-type transport system involved in multi-copper enzyme maturation permease subunit
VRRANDPRDNTGHYLEKHVNWVVAIISTVVAAILLIGAIIGLYIEQNPIARLAMISSLTTFFALSVGLLTNARRAEIFATTAAYAAVLVVFVSSNLGNSNPV